ncbi:hypothetical protein IGI04_004676 [Brassica rapa subsp. trilocularis]|uniref:CASP-like protein n=1 Tax=Brassica rapa subsp. trilocularis TaxID=1813537 RepID=A0ABQ7NBS5_BRACM|nr:hypothetical protein IGI04_004676 [Brassica rapa subsp. trilocularis]
MAAFPSTSFSSSSDMSSVFSDSNHHRNDRRHYSSSDRDIDSLKMTKEEPTPVRGLNMISTKRLAALIASTGCTFMGLCDFVLSREYE